MIYRRIFRSAGGIAEGFFSGCAEPGPDFRSDAASLLAEYREALAGSGLHSEGTLLLRFHLSDPVNQRQALREVTEELDLPVAVIGQPPTGGSRIALEAWVWSSLPRRYEARFFQRSGTAAGNSYEQTAAEFAALDAELRSCGGSVPANAQRTWLYCRDVDNDYAGLVAARNDFFRSVGLRADTHFITSTGIGGEAADPARKVRMDTLLWFGLADGQVDYLSAPNHLSPTALYGVAFERGSRIAFGDRTHCYISGTASIDRDGKVMYPGNVRAQAGRMIENVSVLLESGGSSLADLRQATVYLRDGADAEIVRGELLRNGVPEDLPLVMVTGRVCRPAWLVEMEAIAISPIGDDRFMPLA